MTWEIIGLILKDNGATVAFAIVLGWAYWQERKQNIKNAESEKIESKAMIIALVEVRDALRSFREAPVLIEIRETIKSLKETIENSFRQ